MVLISGKRWTRFIAVGILSLVLIFSIHLLDFATPFSNPDDLSASMDVITACATSDSEHPNDSHSAVPQIPNVVHQIWKTTDLRTYSTQMTASHDRWKQTLEPLNFKIKLWTDDDVLHLINGSYPWLLSTYEGYPQNIQRADMARLLVIHAEGGIYADLDVYPTSATQIQCLQSLSLEAIFAPVSGTLGLSNHFFMAEPRSPFLLWALYEGKRRGGATSRFIPIPYLRVFWSTGPTMVTAAFRNEDWLVFTYPTTNSQTPSYSQTTHCTMESIPSLPATLNPALSGRDAIADALHRCVLGLDTNDMALFDSSFTPTATFSINGKVSSGLPAIHTNCFGIIKKLDTTHFVTNIRINIADSGVQAAATASAIAQHYPGGKGNEANAPHLLAGAQYYADFVKDEGSGLWKIETFKALTPWSEGDWGVITVNEE
ncbi:hypothetical protein PENFLA_c007G03545 [Penicillium flavigenum]|uniref:SnoaL-like domain-containing protein n=1 Tax=Penicillium flavigenum TaxID=254877 RepID=A0A1V6TI22_9EURO|nr:hypothetical protein PENFLA_c007G03545 [Penicillium flavigenum]